MADNVTISQGTGTTITTEDLGGGLQIQTIKIQFGAHGAASNVTTGTPLPTTNANFPTASAVVDADAPGSISRIAVDPLVFNGTNWDRVRSVSVGDAQSTGLPAQGGYTYNGTNWDRGRSANAASGTSGTGVPASGSMYYDGTNWQRRTAATADGLSAPATVAGATFNGTTWDRQRGNNEGTAFASAARTATATSPTFTNYNGKGVFVTLNITLSSGTGGLQPQLQASTDGGVTFLNLNAAPTAITSVGIYGFSFYPGNNISPQTPSANQTVSYGAAVPRTWRLVVTHGDSSSYTYSATFCVIQ